MKNDANTKPLRLGELEQTLAEIKRLNRHVAYYREIIEDSEIVCNQPD